MDTATRDRLIAEDPASEQILKPILRGRDIARYRANWANLWLIDTHNGYGHIPAVDVSDYPAVKAHLDSFLEPLSRRRDKGATPYNLRNCAYHEKFAEEKLVWIELADRGRFAYDDTGVFVEATTFMATGEQMTYLCAFLNSKLAHWYLRNMAPTSGMGVSRWKKVYVEGIPIPMPTPEMTVELGRLVREARSCLSDNDLTSLALIEKHIDMLIFESYELSSKGQSIINRAMNPQ